MSDGRGGWLGAGLGSTPPRCRSARADGHGTPSRFSPTLIAAQSSVGWAERGVVTANNLFSRSIGSAVGVAVFGAIANATLGSAAAASGAGSTAGSAPPAALAQATHDVFLAALLLAVVMFAAAWLLPGGRPTPLQSGDPSADPAVHSPERDGERDPDPVPDHGPGGLA